LKLDWIPGSVASADPLDLFMMRMATVPWVFTHSAVKLRSTSPLGASDYAQQSAANVGFGGLL